MVASRWLPQFSLRGFLIATLVIALGIVGVLSASDGWTFALGAAAVASLKRNSVAECSR